MVVIIVFGTGVNPTLAQISSNIFTNPIDTSANGVDEDRNGYVDDTYGWNFWNNNNNPWPENGDPYPWHETAVTGILAGNGTSGVSGVCPKANVYLMKKGPIEDVSTNTSVPDKVAAGLRYAINLKSELQSYYGKPVHVVINNSYLVMIGTADWAKFPQLKSAIDAAAAADIGMFFAATNASQSNDNPNTAAYPASYGSPNVVSVGAVDQSDRLSSVSNYGNAVHIAAPAVGITLVYNTGQVGVDLAGTQGFTSFATPHVTAAAAMYWSLHPDASFADVKAALLNTADHIPGLPVLNGNRLNLGRLIAGGGTGTGTGTISPDGTTISGGAGSLTTSEGTWTFGAADGSGNNWYILLNGRSAAGGIGSKMQVSGGKMYAFGTDSNWYLWTGATWTPGTPTGSNPWMGSPNGTTIPPANQIVDGAGNVWTVSAGKSYVNGVPDGAAFIVTLLWYNGVVYLTDQYRNCYSHASGQWARIGGDPRG
jgi:hypothetical protein